MILIWRILESEIETMMTMVTAEVSGKRKGLSSLYPGEANVPMTISGPFGIADSRLVNTSLPSLNVASP